LDRVMPALQLGVVPPTPITWGEFAGLSTPRMLLQSRLPLSPEAANQDCPFALPFAKMLSSVCCVAVDTPASHTPQLVETTWPGLSLTMRLYATVKSASDVEAAMELRMRAPRAEPCAYSTSSAISVAFWLLNLQPDGFPEPVQTCPLPAASAGSPHCALKVVLSLSIHAYTPAMTIVCPVPVYAVVLS